jgi:hypothetical protein
VSAEALDVEQERQRNTGHYHDGQEPTDEDPEQTPAPRLALAAGAGCRVGTDGFIHGLTSPSALQR